MRETRTCVEQGGDRQGAWVSDPFRYDLFISYAHGPRDAKGRGPLQRWSQQFRDLLEVNLSLYLGRPARIFFDEGERLNESLDALAPLETQFAQDMAQSAMLQVHVSRPYLGSKWCAHELNGWLASLPTKLGGIERRISVVRVGDTGDTAWPEALAPNGTQLPGNRFHDEGSIIPWGFNLDFGGNAPSPAYSAELINTAGVIHRRLVELDSEARRRVAEAEQVRALDAGTAGVRSVYLHGRVRETDLWNRTADELTRLDVEVRPVAPAPDEDEADVWKSLSRVASQCEAMLLVGGNAFELDADLDVVGRDRRAYIQSKFSKFLPCAVVDRTGLKNDRFLRAAKLRGIDWLDARTPEWGDGFRGWLGDAARRTANKYGLDEGPVATSPPSPPPAHDPVI